MSKGETNGFSLAEHDCNICKVKGFCPVECIARYFKDNEDEFNKAMDRINELLDSAWSLTMAEPDLDPKFLMQSTLLMGYIIGKDGVVKFPSLVEFARKEMDVMMEEVRHEHDS